MDIKGYINVDIGSHNFRLDGMVGNTINVGFRARDGDDEVFVGTFGDIIASVVAALGVDQDFETTLRNRIGELESIGPLKDIVEKLLSGGLYITDLAITAVNESGAFKVTEAAFGFRVDLDSLPLGPLTLRGFGVLFEYTVKTPNPGIGVLRQRALPA